MNLITMGIFISIILGSDVEEIVKSKKPYIAPDDTLKHLDFTDYFLKLMKDYSDCYMHPSSTLLPFLNHYDLINPFVRIKKNRKVFLDFLEEIVAASTDKESILYQISHLDQFEHETVMHDLIGLFGASAETSSHTMTSALYFLKKNPEVLKKLKAEIETHFKEFPEDVDAYSKDNILKLDYLNNVVKETLRNDSPAMESLRYKASEDISICGVDISKGSELVVDICGSHYNSDEWIEPFSFIPERFDPTSKYFLKPNSDRPRNPYAYSPFSHGSRSCPGQTLAMLEIKVMLVSLLRKIDYSIDKEMLDRDDVGFGIATDTPLYFTLTAKN